MVETGSSTGVGKSVETAEITDLAVTAAKLASDAVETAKIKDLAVTHPKLLAELLEGIVDIEVSFESGETTTHTIYFPMKVTINKIRSFVTIALAGTDAGTITSKNNGGTNMTDGVVTIAASAAIAEEDSASLLQIIP